MTEQGLELGQLGNEYVTHFNEERPHQAKKNLPLTGEWSNAPAEGAIQCRIRLGGMLKHYHRQAA